MHPLRLLSPSLASACSLATLEACFDLEAAVVTSDALLSAELHAWTTARSAQRLPLLSKSINRLSDVHIPSLCAPFVSCFPDHFSLSDPEASSREPLVFLFFLISRSLGLSTNVFAMFLALFPFRAISLIFISYSIRQPLVFLRLSMVASQEPSIVIHASFLFLAVESQKLESRRRRQ